MHTCDCLCYMLIPCTSGDPGSVFSHSTTGSERINSKMHLNKIRKYIPMCPITKKERNNNLTTRRRTKFYKGRQ